MTRPTPTACVTVDLDTLQCYRDIHGLEFDTVGAAGDPTYTVGVRRLLELLDQMNIRATLFVIGRDTSVGIHHDLLQQADREGHELGNHTYTHHYDLTHRSPQEQRTEIARGEGAIASVTGRAPVGFRTPGYNVTGAIYQLCRSRGYLYDSSIFPCPPYWLAKSAIMAWQTFRGRPSRSTQTPASNLLAPITPYRPDPQHIWRADPQADGPLEIPMCLVPGLRFPVIGTSLHLLGAAGFDLIYPLLRRSYTDILNLEFHAIDFMDATDAPDGAALVDHQPDLAIPWPEKRRRYVHVFNRLREDYLFAPLREAVTALEDPA